METPPLLSYVLFARLSALCFCMVLKSHDGTLLSFLALLEKFGSLI